ncbi:MAG: helix-turn-helix domain-containing protein [Pirellula sp.]|jgi:transcriptional regulator GlxA family with amidase domain
MSGGHVVRPIIAIKTTQTRILDFAIRAGALLGSPQIFSRPRTLTYQTRFDVIRPQSSRPIQVADVLATVPVSRRGLERRFRMILNRIIFEEINCNHVERSRQMLVSTNHSMADIAVKCVFKDSRHVSILFRKFMGSIPTNYRNRFHLKQ